MKKFAFAIGTVAMLGAPAPAADNTPVAPMYRASARAPYNWSGFYMGGHVGAGWQTRHNVRVASSLPPPNAYPIGFVNDSAQRGVLGGVQVGFNWQFSHL